MKTLVSFTLFAGLAMGCQNRDKPLTPTVDRPAAPVETTMQASTPAPERNPSPPATTSIEIAHVGSCQPDSNLQATVTRFTGMADANGDGQISKDEATVLANFLIGGFFFRADANADGVVTADEGRAVRADVARQYPAIGSLFARAKAAAGGDPFAKLGSVLDVEYKTALTATEARTAAQSAIDDLFRIADTNKDNQITRAEVQSLTVKGLKLAEDSVFRMADTNHNGGVDVQEFQNSLQEPLKVAFTWADSDKDGQLTKTEATNAVLYLARRANQLELPVTVQ